MRKIGKKISAIIKSDIFGRLGAMLIAAILLTLCGVCSFAWFSQNRRVDESGLQISVHTSDYDLLIERTTRYDAGYDVITGTGHTKDSLIADYFSLTDTSSRTSPALAYELVNEYRYENKYDMRPGSYGTLTFYLRPLTNTPLSIHFSLGLGGYVITYDNENNESFDAVDSTVVLDLLKGHILFFTERTGADFEHYVYDGLIDDGTFTYNTSDNVLCSDVGKTDCYKIVLYWEWPITYYDIVDELSTDVITRRFPEETTDYLENTEYFFLSVPDGANLTQMSDAYNDADQAIGTGVDCIVAYVSTN